MLTKETQPAARRNNGALQAAIGRVLPPRRAYGDLPLPHDLLLPPLAVDSGFDVPIGDRMATFVPVAGLFGPGGTPSALLERPMIAGVIINCHNQTWTVESQPTTDGFQLRVHAPGVGRGRRRAVMLVGGGRIVAGRDGAPTIAFNLSTPPGGLRLAIPPARPAGAATPRLVGTPLPGDIVVPSDDMAPPAPSPIGGVPGGPLLESRTVTVSGSITNTDPNGNKTEVKGQVEYKVD